MRGSDSVDAGAGDARCFLLIGLAGAAQGRTGAVVEHVQPTFTEPPHPLIDGPTDIRRYEFVALALRLCESLGLAQRERDHAGACVRPDGRPNRADSQGLAGELSKVRGHIGDICLR